MGRGGRNTSMISGKAIALLPLNPSRSHAPSVAIARASLAIFFIPARMHADPP